MATLMLSYHQTFTYPFLDSGCSAIKTCGWLVHHCDQMGPVVESRETSDLSCSCPTWYAGLCTKMNGFTAGETF